MDISTLSALGSSGVQVSNLLALLGTSSTTSTGSSATGSSLLSAVSGSQSDTLSLSAQGQAAGGLLTDLNNLGTLISSGDLTGAAKALAAIQAKMPSGGSPGTQPATSGTDTIGSDFTALSAALTSGDTRSAQSAFKTLQSDLAKGPGGPPPSSGGSNPLAKDMTQLGSLISSGDLTDAQSLLAQITQRIQHAPSGSQTGTGSDSGSSTSSASSSSSSSSTSTGTLATDLSTLASALTSGDSTSSQTAYQTLLSDLTRQGSSSSATGQTQDAWLLAAYQSSAALAT